MPLAVLMLLAATPGPGAPAADVEQEREVDPLDALLELPPLENAESTVEVLEAPSSGGPSAYLNLGALVLMTAEGNFPRTFLDSDEEIDVVFFPNTGAEQTVTVQAWDIDSLLRPGPRNLYPSLVLTAEGEWFPADGVGFRTFLTTGEVRAGSTLEPPVEGLTLFGESAGEFAASGLWLGAAEFIAYAGPVTLELGRRFASVGDGRVYQDVGTGVFLTIGDYDVDGGLSLDASAFAAGRRFSDLEKPSPMVTLALRYDWGLINEIELFVASYWDRRAAIDDVARATRAEAVLQGALNTRLCTQLAEIAQITETECAQVSLNSVLLDESGERAQLTYIGARIGAQLGPVRVRGNAILNLGSYEFIDSNEATARLVLRGFGSDLDVALSLGAHFAAGLLGLYYTGYDPELLSDRNYTSFIAVAPLWTYSTLFFTNGINQTFTAARASAAGINGHGVLGGGPRLEWARDEWTVEARALALFADEPIDGRTGGGGSFYGFEPNLMMRWQWGQNLGFQAIGGVLVPGSFFPENTLAYRALLIVDGSFEL